MRNPIVLMLCAALALPGCATTGTTRVPAGAAGDRQVLDPAVLAEYVQKLPAGSPVKVERRGGRAVRGTLMKATDQVLIVQPRTRIPEPPIEIPLSDVVSVAPDTPNGGNIGKAIGIGAAAGAAAALGVFLIILAAFAD
jgi:hypothetical protein